MHIGIVNASSVLADGDVSWMVRACDLQARDFAKDWELSPWPVIFYKKIEDLPNATEVRPIVLTDGSPAFKELGYHSYFSAGDYIYGRVFAKTILENGGGILGGKDVNISDVLSHEVLEMRGNPFLLDFALGPPLPTGRYYAKEACDAVQRDLYTVKPKLLWGTSKDVSVSNYLLPSWWSNKIPGPFDKLGNLPAPFMLNDGGYAILKDDVGRKNEVFAQKKPPAWMMTMKRDLGARTYQMGSEI